MAIPLAKKLIDGDKVAVIVGGTRSPVSLALVPIMQEAGFLKSGDEPHARKVLRAAALTYVAASLFSVLNLSRWLVLLRR